MGGGRARWAMGVDVDGAAFALRIVAVARRVGPGSGESCAGWRLRKAGSWHQHDMASSERLPVWRRCRSGAVPRGASGG